ncbi:sacsin N-terminal ATP-binding-like domain-containing protein [Promicromonospora sukumoe]|uniref:sacsin N-terminal ATP-binding-like domain-containing protein n=1 Tax=Promicromonospora sukumoe TaxID=88382 RepID=UPI0036526E92
MTHDPFGTGALRRAVTEAWLASPTRFREDANSEEDHARGWYRDRVVVELAQNAADAAARAGVPGRLMLTLEPRGYGGDDGYDSDDPGGSDVGWWLVAANTGAALDADGVASLASLRASAKSGSGSHGVVGRFGVGFAAVRSVSDEILVRSRDGGVRFSLAATREALGLAPELGHGPDGNDIGPLHRDRSDDGPVSGQQTDLASSVGAGGEAEGRLAAEAARRGGALPVLRLPFPAPGTTPEEPDTVVELRLRDDAAVAAVRAQLAAVDDGLLLALPALDELVIEDDYAGQPGSDPGETVPHATPRVLRDVSTRWRVHRSSGALEPDGSLPSEARRPDWSVLWALPVPGSPAAGGLAAAGPTPNAPTPNTSMLHAPTPTDVRLTFPALLVASFPVDPGRRGVLPGPTSDRVAAEAGRAYAAFLGELAAGSPDGDTVTGGPSTSDPLTAGASGGPGPAPDGAAGPDLLGLVPAGLPAGEVDAAIRASAAEALRDTPLLRSSAEDLPVAPRDAAFVAGPLGEEPGLARALAPGAPRSLVTVPVRYQALVRSLGADAVDLADLVEALPPEPDAVRAALDALAPHAGEPAVLEAVAGMPLPLADGRVTRGARGTVLLDTPRLAGIARALGVRVVHPDSVHPLLERAGAVPTTPRGLLADAGVRSAALGAAEDVLDDGDAVHLAAVLSAGSASGPDDDNGADDDGPAETVSAVLELVRLAVAESGPSDLPFWLGELPVVADGAVVPLRETVLPDTWAARHLDLAPVDAGVVEHWGGDALAAAGAHADLGVYRVGDVVTPDGDDDADYGPDDPAGWLADWDEYLDLLADELGDGAWVGDVAAVPDLDALTDVAGTEPEQSRLAAGLARIAADPDLRRALLTPVRSPDAPDRQAVSYTAWFLRRRLGAPFALGDVPLLPPAPPETAGLDADLLLALGGLHNLTDLPGRDWPAVLEGLPDAESGSTGRVRADVARAVWAGLAALARSDGPAIAPPRLPALGPSGITVERTDDLAVAASPRGAQLGPVVPAPADVAQALADLLDLPLEGGSDVGPDEPGEPVELDPRVRAVVPGAPATWRRHATLTVEGRDVAWWVTTGSGEGAGAVAHAVSPEGLARALAELTGTDALLLEAALRDPGRAEALDAERAWG